jgi:branched-chain amino acid transport system permease protein
VTVDVASYVVDGLLRGSVYALVGVGFSLMYDVLRLVNLAHGSLVMAAMLLAWGLSAGFGIDPYASLPLVTLVLFATGYGLHAGVIQQVSRGRPGQALVAAVLATGSIALVLEALAYGMVGNMPRVLRAPYMIATTAIGPLSISVSRLSGAAVAAMLGGMLYVFMSRTDTGRSIRAVAREPVAACLVGIRPARMRALAYGVGTACLGAAGCLSLPGMAVGWQTGPMFLLVAIAAAVVGGLGSLPGAVTGGLVVGVAESLGGIAAIGGVLLVGLGVRGVLSLWGRRVMGAVA